jgi:hypothetical protein
VICRADIGYAITKLAAYSDRPACCHYQAVKCLFRYLRQTKTWGLVYWHRTGRTDLKPGDEKLKPQEKDLPPFPYPDDPYALGGPVDAAHANDVRTRQSTTGLALCIGGTAVAYQSKKQGTVATSSTEAEFIAAVHAAKIVKYMRWILLELGYQQTGSTTLYEDNQEVILMANADKPTVHTRHIDI